MTLIDGVVGMEGQGPGKSGIPRQMGIIAGSKSAIALDHAICQMVDIEPDTFPTHIAARNLGLFDDDVQIEGDFEIVTNFQLPQLSKTTFGPKALQRVIRKHMLQRPMADYALCELCGECWRYCPAKAISLKKKRITFDYDKCIRCYCCLEVCPQGALMAEETLPGKIIRRFSLGS
jgi:ferredoxin